MGMAVGAGMYVPAFLLTMTSLFVLVALDRVEKRKALTGQIKQLLINFDTDAPPVNQVREIVKKQSIFIYDISVERNYKAQTSQVTIKLQAKPRETLDILFEEIHLLGAVNEINLTVLF